ncbi:MAG: hypothetical protein ACJAQ6_001141 [Arenicella sp.]|jgi:hypothetical protein
MIKQIFDLPDNVLGFKGSGEITALDYQTVLVPALETTLSKTRRARLIYVLDEDFDGFTAGAAWQDAKVGLMHITRFERLAVVTDADWIRKSIKAFGFAMPGEVRVYDGDQLLQAREWVSAPPPHGDLSFEFLEQQGVLILRPKGELNVEDFARVSAQIDPFIEEHGALKGIMIVADHFPGWDDLGAFFAHIRFIKGHRKNTKRLAIVSSDKFLSVLPRIVNHLVVSESQHYSMEQAEQALGWVSQG